MARPKGSGPGKRSAPVKVVVGRPPKGGSPIKSTQLPNPGTVDRVRPGFMNPGRY